eukprot:2857784-Amphidinium_carterae.1
MHSFGGRSGVQKLGCVTVKGICSGTFNSLGVKWLDGLCYSGDMASIQALCAPPSGIGSAIPAKASLGHTPRTK